MKSLYALVLASCLASPLASAEKQAEVWYNSSGEAALVTWEEKASKNSRRAESTGYFSEGASQSSSFARKPYSLYYSGSGFDSVMGYRHARLGGYSSSYRPSSGRCYLPYQAAKFHTNMGYVHYSNNPRRWSVSYSRPGFSINYSR